MCAAPAVPPPTTPVRSHHHRAHTLMIVACRSVSRWILLSGWHHAREHIGWAYEKSATMTDGLMQRVRRAPTTRRRPNRARARASVRCLRRLTSAAAAAAAAVVAVVELLSECRRLPCRHLQQHLGAVQLQCLPRYRIACFVGMVRLFCVQMCVLLYAVCPAGTYSAAVGSTSCTGGAARSAPLCMCTASRSVSIRLLLPRRDDGHQHDRSGLAGPSHHAC